MIHRIPKIPSYLNSLFPPRPTCLFFQGHLRVATRHVREGPAQWLGRLPRLTTSGMKHLIGRTRSRVRRLIPTRLVRIMSRVAFSVRVVSLFRDRHFSCTRPSSGNPERASRVVFLDLPIEILELIASSLHDPLPIEAAARFIDERYSDFCVARFWLSGFSKVCSSVRKTVERVLYREVQLDFTGWKGRKHPIWRAGSLRLLLRTFEERPELGRFVHGASLDYQLYNEPGPLDLGLKQFLMLTPNLKTLFMAQCPLVLWDLPPLNISTFATTFAPGILPSILQQFPKLQNIHLRDCHVMPFSLDLPKHNLRTVRFDSSHDHAVVHFARALTLCFDTVHHLDIRFIGGFLQPAPFFAPKSPSIKCSLNTRLRSLRLHNISVFSHVGSAYAQLLQNLPALQELHVSNHMCFDPLAFSVLPSSLRKLTISDYYGYWEMRPEDAGNTFLLALAKSINISPRKIRHIVGANGRNTHDLSPVVAACELEGIKYSDVDDKNGFVQIFCEWLGFYHAKMLLTNDQSRSSHRRRFFASKSGSLNAFLIFLEPSIISKLAIPFARFQIPEFFPFQSNMLSIYCHVWFI